MPKGMGYAKDGMAPTKLKKGFKQYGANVRTSRLNAGGDRAYKGKRKSSGGKYSKGMYK